MSGSKISRNTLNECVAELLKLSVEKKRKFRETIELQITLKITTLKRTSVSVELSSKLENIPCPKLRVCVLGDQQYIDGAATSEIPCMSADDLKKLNKDKKMIKNFGQELRRLHCLRVFDQANSRILGPGLNKAGKFPSSSSDDRRCSACQCGYWPRRDDSGGAVANISLGINFLVSLLKKIGRMCVL
uniref:Uncharacterized protein n=1 Tax=Ditylenchus dipsaci TaxID=166011 RepID=A0A915ESB9_9BILA